MTTVALHPSIHFDEAVAMFIAQEYGEERFPGIRDAKIVFWKTGKTPDGKSAEAWIRQGVLPIGVGQGPFDEHTQHGRVAKTCTALLVADFLGVSKKPELAKLLKYALDIDTRAISQPFSLPTILKEVNLLYGQDQERIVGWACQAIRAHVQENKQAAKNEAAVTYDLALADFICQHHVHYGATEMPEIKPAVRELLAASGTTLDPVAWLRNQFSVFRTVKGSSHVSAFVAKTVRLVEHPHFKHLFGYLNNPAGLQKSGHPQAADFELPNIISAIDLVHSGNHTAVLDWVASVVAAKVYTAQLFQDAAVEYEKAKAEKIAIQGGKATLVSIVSDNPKMMAYSHSKAAEKAGRKADVFILRSTSGHTSIFADPDIELRDVVKLLRYNELKLRKLPIPHKHALEKEGDGPEDVFYFFRQAGHIYNGSHSSPDVSATQLTLDEIIHTVKLALNPKQFPVSVAAKCLAGHCASTPATPCPIYFANLHRCGQIRFKEKQSMAR